MDSAVLRAAHVRDDAPPWVLEDNLSERLHPSGSLTPEAAASTCWKELAFHRSRCSMRRHSGTGTFRTAVICDSRIRHLFASPESDCRRWVMSSHTTRVSGVSHGL
jgi:hypothetical protein